MGQGELDSEEMSAHVSRGDEMPDWEKIRAEYIAGGISIREIAQKYGINRGAVGRKAKAENWAEDRAKTASIVRQKTDDTIVSRLSEAYAENADIAERIRMKLLARLEREIDALPDSIGTRLSRDGKECKLRDLTGAYLDLTRDAPDAAKTGDFSALDEVDYGQ